MDLFSSNTAPSVLSVSELASGLSAVVEEAYGDVEVEGELSNFTRAASGHCYFTLKDDEAQIRCVMWRHMTKYVFFEPADGMQVRLHGQASVYERRGDLQILARSMRRAGKGAQQEAFERLKRQLDAEGLFDPARKKDLPLYPECVGVVTSGQGAAVQDILSVMARRFPSARVVLCPVPVQGLDAPQAIADAIEALNAVAPGNADRADVVIVGRGGGSAEDLWAFNEEVVARAIAASALPVISAVGHETDMSIADFVADRRAATPSMAAEIVVPDGREVEGLVRDLHDRLRDALLLRVRDARQQVERLTARRAFHEPVHRLQQYQQRLDGLISRLPRTARLLLERKHVLLDRLHHRLQVLDPEQPLRRGYAYVERDGTPVRTAQALRTGDSLTLHFSDGTRRATVTDADG